MQDLAHHLQTIGFNQSVTFLGKVFQVALQRDAKDLETVTLEDFLKLADTTPAWDASLRKINEQARVQDEMKIHLKSIMTSSKKKKESFLHQSQSPE